jgi:heterodisulfide reductase subunit A2
VAKPTPAPKSTVSLNPAVRIGFYICRCGHNIGSVGDCPQVARHAAERTGVMVARDDQYMRSGPGQELVLSDTRRTL